MLRKGLADGVASGESSFEESVKPTPEQAKQRFENYELVTGKDVTYKAFDVDLHCPVTLKVISERFLADESARLRFLRAKPARRRGRSWYDLEPAQRLQNRLDCQRRL